LLAETGFLLVENFYRVHVWIKFVETNVGVGVALGNAVRRSRELRKK
jgi:hypothetical protein